MSAVEIANDFFLLLTTHFKTLECEDVKEWNVHLLNKNVLIEWCSKIDIYLFVRIHKIRICI